MSQVFWNYENNFIYRGGATREKDPQTPELVGKAQASSES